MHRPDETMTIHDPADITIEDFVVGPDLDWDDLDIDPVFGKSFDRALAELSKDMPDALDPADGDSCETASYVHPSLIFRSCVCGVVLFDGDTPVGGMLETDLVLHPAWHGRGLGREIVLESYMRDGEFRIWNLDIPAFSPEGLAAFEGAWTMGRDRAIFDEKARRLTAAMTVDGPPLP